jgi:D-serine deaminase-like pyridoxal phosphate-dependent protein
MPQWSELDTPCVLIDLPRVEANLRRAQAYADAHGLALRPHIKTHKLVRFAKRQVDLGAVGVTCQKLGEAEIMADAGIADIFLPYNIVGEQKRARLLALAERVTLAVTLDSEATLEGLAVTFRDAAKPLSVLIECDTGMGRAGVQSPAEALGLARRVANTKGLVFKGLMTYPAAGAVEANAAWLAEAAALLAAEGLPAEVVSNGGTPDLWRSAEVKAATEHRPGTYIYLDRFQVARGVGGFEDCALHVLTTVVSRPTETRAILDAGSKTLSSDTMGMEGFGRIEGYPEAVIRSLSEEHAIVDLSACARKPVVGEKVRVLPNHACVVSNLFDKVALVDADGHAEMERVDARGRVD